MTHLEPVPDEPAAVADCAGQRCLLIADYHAGIEAGFRAEQGIEVPSQAPERRERLRALVDQTTPDRLVICGDLMHAIGHPGGAERGELEVLVESVSAIDPTLDITLVKGNHDGDIETWLDGVEVVSGGGLRIGALGICHGHTWPTREVLEAETVCLGHEHPCVRLEDEVGGSRVEPAWLRGQLASLPFCERPEYDGLAWLESGTGPELVVLPAFNDFSGGTWVNVADQSFLAPFFPAGIAHAEAYLLDGTRLGPYQSV